MEESGDFPYLNGVKEITSDIIREFQLKIEVVSIIDGEIRVKNSNEDFLQYNIVYDDFSSLTDELIKIASFYIHKFEKRG